LEKFPGHPALSAGSRPITPVPAAQATVRHGRARIAPTEERDRPRSHRRTHPRPRII